MHTVTQTATLHDIFVTFRRQWRRRDPGPHGAHRRARHAGRRGGARCYDVQPIRRVLSCNRNTQTAALLSRLVQARGPLLQAVEAPGFQDRLVRHGGRYAQALRQRAVLAEVVAGLQSTDPSELAGPRKLAIGAAWVRRHQSSALAQKDAEANLGCVCALHKPVDNHACMVKRVETTVCSQASHTCKTKRPAMK